VQLLLGVRQSQQGAFDCNMVGLDAGKEIDGEFDGK